MNKRASAVVQRNGLFLVCKRPANKPHAGLWEFPGGKIEPGEWAVETASRELLEELSLKSKQPGDLYMSLIDRDSGFVVHFVNVETEGDPIRSEHTELAWVTCQQLLQMDLAPTDHRFVEYLVARAAADH